MFNPLLIGTLDLIKKAGYDVKIIWDVGHSRHVWGVGHSSHIDVLFEYHKDEHCQLIWHIYIDSDEIRLFDSANGFVQAWDLRDPQCFDALLKELEYLEFIRSALEAVYPQAKADGIIPHRP